MTGPRSSRLSLPALCLLLGVIALLPRVFNLRTSFMIDEKLWLERSAHFTDEVFSGHLGRAFTTGHPGVTTMWVAGLAQRTLPRDAPLDDRTARGRRARAVVDAILLVVIWLLARRLLPAGAALLAFFLIAFDPFLLAHTRVLHLDGLQTLLMLASFLALLAAVRRDDQRLLMWSGALAGFAVLTKTPSAVLGVAAFVVLWRDGRGVNRRITLWLLAALGVFVIAWPLVWMRPWKAVALLARGGAGIVDDSDAAGFFLGRRVVNPGPLFYPVVYAFRTSIVTLPAGIAAVAWATRRRRTDPDALLAFTFAAFGIAFAVLIAVVTKVADRYLLPSLAALDVAIAIAVWKLVRVRARAVVVASVVAVLAVHAGPVLTLGPYQLAHYNWLVGGPLTAQHALVIGRGEGLTEAAHALNEFARASSSTVATTRLRQFEEFFRGRTVRVEDSVPAGGTEQADFVLFYVSSFQVGRAADVLVQFAGSEPVYELDINHIPYVRVWRVTASERA
jgi:hypothetical protein